MWAKNALVWVKNIIISVTMLLYRVVNVLFYFIIKRFQCREMPQSTTHLTMTFIIVIIFLKLFPPYPVNIILLWILYLLSIGQGWIWVRNACKVQKVTLRNIIQNKLSMIFYYTLWWIFKYKHICIGIIHE